MVNEQYVTEKVTQRGVFHSEACHIFCKLLKRVWKSSRTRTISTFWRDSIASFHEFLTALMILHRKIVRSPLADRIAKDSKYFPYFERTVLALWMEHIFRFMCLHHKQHPIAIGKAIYHKTFLVSAILTLSSVIYWQDGRAQHMMIVYLKMDYSIMTLLFQKGNNNIWLMPAITTPIVCNAPIEVCDMI